MPRKTPATPARLFRSRTFIPRSGTAQSDWISPRRLWLVAVLMIAGAGPINAGIHAVIEEYNHGKATRRTRTGATPLDDAGRVSEADVTVRPAARSVPAEPVRNGVFQSDDGSSRDRGRVLSAPSAPVAAAYSPVVGGGRERAPEPAPSVPRRAVEGSRPSPAARGTHPGISTVINGSFTVDVNNGNSPYVINPSDTLTVTGETYIGYTSTGTISQNGGTFNSASGALILLGTSFVASGTYNLNGGTLAAAGIRNGLGTGTLNFNGGTLQALANNNLFVGNIAAVVRNAGAVIDTNGFDVAIAGPLTHSTNAADNATDGGLTKNGAGTLTLDGVNTYTGPTTINAGTLAVVNSVGGDSSHANGIYFNGTSTLLGIADVTLARDLIFRTDSTATSVSTAATIAADTATTMTFRPGFVTLNGNLQLTFGLAGHSGTVILDQPVGYGTQGSTQPEILTVAGGTLQSGGDTGVGGLTNFFDATVVNAGATLDFNGYDARTTTITALLRNLQGAGTVLTGGNAATNITVGAGYFTGVIAGPGQITKTTGGSLVLAGPSTYTGGTTVNGGVLLVNNVTGSATGTGGVLVNAGAILAGQGTVAGSVTVASGGTLAPGNSVGTLSTGSLGLEAGSIALMDLDPAHSAGGGDHDEVDVTGSLELDNATLKLNLLSAPTLGERFALFLNDGTDPVAGTFAQGATVSASFDGQTYLFAIDYAANLDGGTVGNDVELTVLPVPEPSEWVCCGVGLLVGGTTLARRRHRPDGHLG